MFMNKQKLAFGRNPNFANPSVYNGFMSKHT